MKSFILAVLALCAATLSVHADEDRVISVMGVASVEMPPDMATIDLGVSHQADEAADALAMTSEAVAAVLAQLESAGIEARDMQTNNLSLQPVWSRNDGSGAQPKVIGFVARNTLSIRVRELNSLGSILDAVVQDGANTFNGLRFSVQDPDAAMAEARAAAVKDGVARAEQFAAAAGVTLGPIMSISEGGGIARPQMLEMAAARMASDVPVAQGEVSLSSQVSMVFAIAD